MLDAAVTVGVRVDEICAQKGFRIRQEGLDVAVMDQTVRLVEHQGTRAELGGQAEIVLRGHGRDRQIGKEVHQPSGGTRIQRGRRIVQQQQSGFVGEYCGQKGLPRPGQHLKKSHPGDARARAAWERQGNEGEREGRRGQRRQPWQAGFVQCFSDAPSTVCP